MSCVLRGVCVVCYTWCACHVAYSGRLSTSTGSHVACALATGFLLLACRMRYSLGCATALLLAGPRRQSACPVCLGKERGERHQRARREAQYASLFDADSPSLLLQLPASLDTHALSLSRSLVLRMNGMGKVCKL